MKKTPSILCIRQFLALAGLTALKITRQPICLLLTASSIAIMGIAPLLMMYNFGENGKLVRDSSLAVHFVFGVFITGYAACSTLAQEIRKGTASAVLSKPVGRNVFFLSKFAGVLAVVTAFSLICTITTLLSEKACEKFFFGGNLFGYLADSTTNAMLLIAPIAAFAVAAFLNYRFRKPFQSTAFSLTLMFLLAAFVLAFFVDEGGKFGSFRVRIDLRILPASITVTLALFTLSAIALSISSRLSLVPTLAILCAVLLSGLLSEYLLENVLAPGNPVRILVNLIPDWQNFWVCDALNSGGRIPWTYVANTGVYAMLYSTAVLCLGLISFSNADMK